VVADASEAVHIVVSRVLVLERAVFLIKDLEGCNVFDFNSTYPTDVEFFGRRRALACERHSG
jgi:hypothetical protein